METVLISKLESARITDNGKNQTSFVKDAPKFARYSLSDSCSNETGMDYHIQVANSEDQPRMLKFLRRFFFRDEPLNQSIELIPEGEDSTCVELEEYSMSCLKDNLSLIAISETGAVIGVVLNGAMEPPQGNGEPDYIKNCANPKFKKILKLLNYVDKNAKICEKFPCQRVLELRIISVDSSWRGRGVGKALIEKTVQVGEECGFHVIRSDCSSLFSGKLCQRCGFESVYELLYANYLGKDGKPIFMPAQPHNSIVTYVKKI